MRQFRKLFNWKQRKPRKNLSPDPANRRSVSLQSIRKASIGMAISSLGFPVQFSQSDSQISDGSRCSEMSHDQINGSDGTWKMGPASSGIQTSCGHHAKKRSTTSSPPDETAAGVPPRLPESSDTDFRVQRTLTIDVMPRVEEEECREEVESVLMRDYEDEMETLQAQLRAEMPPKTPRSVFMEDVCYEQEELILPNPSLPVTQDPATSTQTSSNTVSQAPPTERTPSAPFLTLPPELVLEISKYLPFCSHTALYDTCSRLNRVIRDNNSAYYERELAKAGANPRGDSLLTRSIFAFQYLNRPSHTPDAHPEFSISSSFGYIRYLKAQSQTVKDLADILQSEVFKNFLLSEEGRKQLRLTAHGSHEPEDLSSRDDVDRDLMHLWEFVNYSVDKLVRTEVPMYYPHGDQKVYYDATMPFPLLSTSDDTKAEQLRKNITKLGKDTQFPHDQFLVWERKRLRDMRNEYWKEDTDNLSKVESKDMRWILEVIKALFVGVVFKPFIEGPREKNRAIMELKAKALRKVSRNATPQSPADNNQSAETEGKRIESLLNLQEWPGSQEATTSPGDVMSEDWQMPPYSQTYTEQEIRAYVAYLVATGGMKLLLAILRAAIAHEGVLTPERLNEVLEGWDRIRKNGEVENEEFMKGFDADKAREREKTKEPEKEEFGYLWRPVRVERIWERDCKRGGWSNWEGWVAEYYLIA